MEKYAKSIESALCRRLEMKQLICQKCGRKQQNGKFCLDCGNPLTEVITSGVKFRVMDSGKQSDQIKKDIRNWLMRIGVQQPDIRIDTGDGARVEYVLANKKYLFCSTMQKDPRNNLAAVEQFLHYRVLGIERGIETAEQAEDRIQAIKDYLGTDNAAPEQSNEGIEA